MTSRVSTTSLGDITNAPSCKPVFYLHGKNPATRTTMDQDFDEMAGLIENDELQERDNDANDTSQEPSERFGLKRQIGFTSTLSLLIGCIIGSGIFASPKSVAVYAGSTGNILLVWVGSGIISMFAGEILTA